MTLLLILRLVQREYLSGGAIGRIGRDVNSVWSSG